MPQPPQCQLTQFIILKHYLIDATQQYQQNIQQELAGLFTPPILHCQNSSPSTDWQVIQSLSFPLHLSTI
jgi:hypothetical protein